MKIIRALMQRIQVIVVVLAFAIMVVISFFFINNVERKHLVERAEEALSFTQAHIVSDLLEPKIVLGSVAETVRDLIVRGDGVERVHEYIIYISDYVRQQSDESSHRLSGMIGFYGFFDVYNGVSLSGVESRVFPETYDPAGSLWYKTAVEANGGIGITQPYDEHSDGGSVTFARRLFDKDSNPLGIVCLDISLGDISGYAVNTKLSEDGYSFLMNGQFDILAHPEPSLLGKNLHDTKSGIVTFEEELRAGHNISERTVTDYRGIKSIVFIQNFGNGWYMGIVTPRDKYYQSARNMANFLISLGAMLTIVLSAILLHSISARREVEERTQALLDAMPLVANFWDKDFRNIESNLEAVKLFGLSSKQEYLDRFFDLSPEYQPGGTLSREKILGYITKAFEEGYCHFEWMHQKLNGESIPCEITLVRIKYKNDFIVAGYTRDLRELKATVAKMGEVEERAQLMLDAMPLSCNLLDTDAAIIDCNQETISMFGLSSKQEYIDRFYDLSPEYQPNGELSKKTIVEYVKKTIAVGYYRFEWTHQKLNGEPILAEVTLIRVKHRGNYMVLSYIRDLRELMAMITQKSKAEIAEESSKAKTKFLATMSHEIRTPLNALIGITEIELQNQSLLPETREALIKINNSSDLLLRIINDILDLSKIEAGKLELENANYNIADLINDTVYLVAAWAESKPIEFKLLVNENIPAELFGDELRIKQILNNLLSNAFKYTESGEVVLDINAKTGNDNVVTLVFRVSDTGQGMTEEQVSRLFDEYSRFNMEANRMIGGTGLGMNITQNLVRLMNGTISVESNPNKGSVFTVHLPQGNTGSAALGREAADNLRQFRAGSASQLKKTQVVREYMPYGRVLVVDDVETNIYVAKGLLSPYGLSIDTAVSGFEAIKRIKSGSTYDIIFMDHMMPKMDGMEATKIIRGMRYENPIVALTANALAGQAEMLLANGFDGFVSKPIDIRQLNVLLNKLIRDKYPPDVIEAARKQKNKLEEYSAGKRLQPTTDPILAKIFIQDAERAVAVLETISKNKYRRKDDIQAYITSAHAMKSALANIGETELSGMAGKLEQAGREQNIDVLSTETPVFLDLLKAVITRIEPEEADEKTVEADPEDALDYLSKELQTIQAACLAYDKKSAKETLVRLRERAWSYRTRKVLNTIAGHLLHSDFEEAENAIKIYLGAIGKK